MMSTSAANRRASTSSRDSARARPASRCRPRSPTPSKSSSFRSRSRTIGAEKLAGSRGVDGGVEDVGGHDRLDARGDRGPERREVTVELGPAAEGDHGQRRVAVVGRGAVAGEVLGDRDHAARAVPRRTPRRARRPSRGRGRTPGRRRPTVGPVGEVEHRREVHRDADRGEVLRHQVCGRLDVGRVAGRARVPGGRELDEGAERRNRLTRPPSWSTATSRPMPGRRAAGEGLERRVYAASWSRSTMFCWRDDEAAEPALDHEPPGRFAGDGAGHGGHDALAELLLEGERGEERGHRWAGTRCASGRAGGSAAREEDDRREEKGWHAEVEDGGFEPPTYRLRTYRSTN